MCLNYRAMYQRCEEFFETMVALKHTDYSKYQEENVLLFEARSADIG